MRSITQTSLSVATGGVGYIQLTLHLVSGGKHRFVQTDPKAAQDLLEHLRPERLFAQKQIMIAGAEAVTVLPTSSVERIDLRSDPLPQWPHGTVVSEIHEILAEDFERIRLREHMLPPAAPVRAAGVAPPLEIGVAAELRSGATVYLSAHPRPPQTAGGDSPLTPDDARAFLQHMFDRPVLFGRMQDEQGLFLINPANAVRFVLAPPPPVQSLASVWTMDVESV